MAWFICSDTLFFFNPSALHLATAVQRSSSLEDTGIALTFGAFRMGYFYGGDGQSVMRYDLRDAAGFVRDVGAVMSNFLLPIKVGIFLGVVSSGIEGGRLY